MTKIIDQPSPKEGNGTPVWDLVIGDIDCYCDKSIKGKVISDMKDRDKIGEARYGTRLLAFNGRNALIDAYQEFLDGVVYLRQELEESPDEKLLKIYKQHISNLIALRELME